MAGSLFGTMASADQFYTSAQLLEECSSENPQNIGQCFGYLMGVFDFVANLDQMYPNNKVKLCYSLPNITDLELTYYFYKLMQDQPQFLNLPASVGAQVAFVSQFGCR
jgi:hypothetical protein